MKLVIICGSLRKKSYTRTLCDLAFSYAKEKYDDVHYLDLGKTDVQQFRGFEEEYSQFTKDAVQLVSGADALIIASPIYNGLLGSGVKNLFEHINVKALEGKAAGYIIESAGTISGLQVQGQLIALLNYFRVISNPRPVFTQRDLHFDKEMKLTNPEIGERIKGLVDETAGLFQSLKD